MIYKINILHLKINKTDSDKAHQYWGIGLNFVNYYIQVMQKCSNHINIELNS
jgi:hypothetical protein